MNDSNNQRRYFFGGENVTTIEMMMLMPMVMTMMATKMMTFEEEGSIPWGISILHPASDGRLLEQVHQCTLH